MPLSVQGHFLFLLLPFFNKCGNCAILMIEIATILSRKGSFLLPLPFNVIGRAKYREDFGLYCLLCSI